MPVNTLDVHTAYGGIFKIDELRFNDPALKLSKEPVENTVSEQLPVPEHNSIDLVNEMRSVVDKVVSISRGGISKGDVDDALTTAGVVSKKDIEAVQSAIRESAKAMAKLDSMTLKALLGSVNKEKGPVNVAIDACCTASEKLLTLLNSCGDNQAGRDKLEALILRIDARASELTTLMSRLDEINSADKTKNTSEFKKISGMQFRDAFAAMQTAVMHGNDRIFKGEGFAELSMRFHELGQQVDSGTFDKDALAASVKKFRAEVQNNGYIGADVRALLVKNINEMEQRLGDVGLSALDIARRNFAYGFFPDPKIPPYFDKNHPLYKDLPIALKKLEPFMEESQKFMKRARDLVTEGYSQEKYEALKNEINKSQEKLRALGNSTGEIKKAFRSFADMTVVKKGYPEIASELREIAKDFNPMRFLRERGASALNSFKTCWLIKDFVDNRAVSGKFSLTNADIAKIVKEGRLTETIEAGINGATEEMLEKDFTKEKLVSSSVLGKGSVNEVKKIAYRADNGEIRNLVFKSEGISYVGLRTLVLGQYGAYDKYQQTAKLNFASSKTAEFLGTPEVITKTTVGVLDGNYGIFMEYAPGMEGESLLKYSTMPPELKSIRNKGYDPNDTGQHLLIGSLAKGYTDLQWNDLLAGQGDRHCGNYKINIENGKCRVIGLDNDMCFSKNRSGLSKFKINKNQQELFNEYYERYFCAMHGYKSRKLKNPDSAESKEYQQAREKSVREIDDKYIEVDLGAEDVDPALMTACAEVIGFKSVLPPPYMSMSMYEKLNDAENIRKMTDMWKLSLDPESADNAVARLGEMQALAEKYKNEGRILSDNRWGDGDVIAKLSKTPPLKNSGLGNDVNTVDAYSWFMSIPSFLARDASKLFDKGIKGEF